MNLGPGNSGSNRTTPNPFNPTTKIQFALPEGTYGHTSLRVYDILGREVATLMDEVKKPGSYG